MAENGVISVSLAVPLASPAQPVSPGTNVQYVHTRLLELLKHAFPHLQEAQLVVFIKGLFALDNDITAFREHLRDFLVQIREISGDDLSDLYLEEREAELAAAEAEKLKQKSGVPGLVQANSSSANLADDGTSAAIAGMTGSALAAAGGMDMAE